MTWFSKLSKAQQKAYLKLHPNSKYAKGSKTKSASTGKSPSGDKQKISKLLEKKKALTNKLKTFNGTFTQKHMLKKRIRNYEDKLRKIRTGSSMTNKQKQQKRDRIAYQNSL